MKVYVYMGAKKIIEKSGVGRAIDHQIALLKEQGVEVNTCTMKDADIVHINTIFPDSVVAALRAKAMGKKVIWYGHSTMEDFKNSFVGSNLFAPIFKKWITFCYGLGDVIITPTPYSRTILKSYGIKKPIVDLSNGIDTGFWKPSEEGRRRFREKYNIPEGKKVVVSVGHYIGRKGLIDFVDLARSMTDVQFMWFGYTDERLVTANIKRAMKTAPMNVVFPGYVDKEELREVYQGADAFCFMSHEETEGIVVLEALACGTPTIVRNIPVYDGWLEDNKNVFKCDDMHQFWNNLNAVLKGKAMNLQSEGYRIVAERDFNSIGKRLVEIYHDYFTNKIVENATITAIGGNRANENTCC